MVHMDMDMDMDTSVLSFNLAALSHRIATLPIFQLWVLITFLQYLKEKF